MPMYDLIEYSDKHLKTSGSLLQYYGHELTLNAAGNIVDFSPDNNSV